jgi:hypothetical protein
MSNTLPAKKFSIKNIPNLRDISEDVVSLERKIAEITVERTHLEAERVSIRKQAADPNAMKERHEARQAADVAQILGDEAPTGYTNMDLSADHSKVVAKIEILDKALRECQRRLEIANRDASVVLCAQVKDVHEALVGAMITSLLATHKACVEYVEFTNALNARDVQWSHLKPMFPRFIGDPNDRYSPIGWYLHTAVESGWLDDVPKELR